jgi:glycine oxidase
MHTSAGDGGADVLVAGGGVIGLAVAWRAAGRGLRVVLADPAPGAATSHVAAGMLAPVTEAAPFEEPLLRLNLESAARYPGFVADLEAAAGCSTAYEACGTLVVALDAGDLAAIDELHAVQASLGLSAERVSGREARRLEPMLAPAVRGGLLVPGDHQADPRRLVTALRRACDRAGVRVLAHRMAAVDVAAGRVIGAVLDSGARLDAARVVLAAGAWTPAIGGLPPGAVPALRPVKGQLLRLRVPPPYAPLLRRVVRGVVRGGHVYLVPRADGELVVGATQEEQGFDTTVTAGAVYELLRDARELVPAITELPLVETLAGLRPCSPDNAPLLGATTVDGLTLATGHHRNGVLLAPVTADAIAAHLAGEPMPAVALPFAPTRFAVAGARS